MHKWWENFTTPLGSIRNRCSVVWVCTSSIVNWLIYWFGSGHFYIVVFLYNSWKLFTTNRVTAFVKQFVFLNHLYELSVSCKKEKEQDKKHLKYIFKNKTTIVYKLSKLHHSSLWFALTAALRPLTKKIAPLVLNSETLCAVSPSL